MDRINDMNIDPRPRSYEIVDHPRTVITPPNNTGVKHDNGKIDWSLIPIEAMDEVLKVFQFGAEKYERWNYRKGFKQSRLIAAAFRHITAHMRGQDFDEESGMRHLAHAGCCILMLLTNILDGQDEDDRYVSR